MAAVADSHKRCLSKETSTKAYWTNQFYGEYVISGLRVDAEYRRQYNLATYVAGSNESTDVRAWYVSGTWRVNKVLSVGSYYSRYGLTYLISGPGQAVTPNQADTTLPQNHVYDKVVAARVDLNRFTYLKIEGHFMDGYGMGPYPNGFYPQENPLGFRPNAKALVLKTGIHF